MATTPSERFGAAELERLYAALERSLFNVVYRWVWDSEEASDIVQEAFVRVWRMRRRVRTETARPLVYRIAVNLASKQRRRKRLWRFVSMASEEGPELVSAVSPDDRLLTDERRRAVRNAVEALPEKLRRVIVLSELSGMSYAEISEALSIPVGTVGSRRHNALEQLRALLGDSQEGADE